MEDDDGTNGALLAAGDSQFKSYMFRWVILIIFMLSGIANAIVLLSWAPISDQASKFFDVSVTEINLLAVMFQICYIPGTLFALWASKRFDLRMTMIIGGTLNTLGCALRWIGVYAKEYGNLSSSGAYGLVLLGTVLTACAQPFYLNMPSKISTAWFQVKQRDIAMTLCSMSNPLGSAIGSIIPTLLVAYQGDDDKPAVVGVSNLTLLQLIISGAAVTLTFLFFKSKPPTPPSASQEQEGQQQSISSSKSLLSELSEIFQNKNYVLLFFSFSIALGNLNAIATLLNQLPGQWTNAEIGLTGFALILSGFIGAFSTGIILEKSKNYKPILKVSYVSAVLMWAVFGLSCRSGNFTFLILSAALLGFFFLPIIPSSIVNAVECTYPAREDLTVGLLYIGANTLAIALTFIGQALLAVNENSGGIKSPFYPFIIWGLITMGLGMISVLFYDGKYLRLNNDTKGRYDYITEELYN